MRVKPDSQDRYWETGVVSLDRKCVGAGPGSETHMPRCCPEAFSIRRLEGRRWQWRALLWIQGRELGWMGRAKRLEEPFWMGPEGGRGSREGAIS